MENHSSSMPNVAEDNVLQQDCLSRCKLNLIVTHLTSISRKTFLIVIEDSYEHYGLHHSMEMQLPIMLVLLLDVLGQYKN